ncbi:MAG: ABC-F family ATP-binding cassette domain-containing protein, partial [Actinobacteria bacterium]|nr:ABC-F family ATP-binding cassette domain-containing protein [Actinomycetota bacterium]
MAVVIASNVRKELAGSLLFDGVSFTVERRDRVALGGPNGAGKTTLLRILAGQTEKHGGELAFERGTRVALHDQRPPLEQELTLREYVLSGARDLVELETELRSLEQAMAGGTHDQATLNRYAAAQARLEHAGGYGWRDHAASVLRGLGFADDDLDRPLRTFSGGELTRASLARALGGDPDLLLLDEPTNHLDVASLEWLERELQSIDAAVILVAHDRWFLEAVTTATLELTAGRATFFPGPWHLWRREKAARALHAQKEVARVEADIARLERFVERFRAKKDKARQAQAKLTQIERLQAARGAAAGEVALLSRRQRSLGFEFLKPARSGRIVVETDGLELSIGDRVLLRNASFALERGEHVALVGPNGSGKTTLLEAIVNERGVR